MATNFRVGVTKKVWTNIHLNKKVQTFKNQRLFSLANRKI